MIFNVWKNRVAWISLVAAIYWSVLFALTHTPLSPGWIPDGVDKVEHCVAYGCLTVLLATAVTWWRGLSFAPLALVWLLVAGYGVFDEQSQRFVRGRSCSLADWYADILGAGLGIAAVVITCQMLGRWRTPRAINPTLKSELASRSHSG
jgi:VanZ family protein